MESELNRVIDGLPALVWAALPDGDVNFVNERWCDYTGVAPQRLLGRGWCAFIHPNDLPHWLKAWDPSAAEAPRGSGEPWEIEARLRRFDGEYRRFVLRAAPLNKPSGERVWWATAFDIEDKARSELTSRKSQWDFAQILDGLPAIVATFTPRGNIRYCNKQMLEYLGETLEQVLAKESAYNFHPDDRDQVLKQWAAAVQSGRPFDCEARLCRADGVYRWQRTRVFPLRNAADEIELWYGLSVDIDDAKQAEAELRRAHSLLTEAQRLSRTGSFTWDVLADEHSWSEEISRIFEFDPAVKVTMAMIQAAIHPADMAAVEAVIGGAYEGTDFDVVFRIVTVSGTVKHAHVVAHRIAQRTDRPVFIGALQDVTESKAAEEALHKARTEFAHVARVLTLSALTASVAHEVNQPLAGIVTNASTCLRMLASDPPNVDGARATAQRTIRDANRASDVIQRLRTLFARKQASIESVDLNDAAREVLALSAHELQRARVTVRSGFAENAPPVRGDRVQLQQVILNLILNAADAMKEVEDRSRELLIATTREDDDRVRLSVRDSGIGIDPQSFEAIFDAFYTTKTDGMGIGLSISRSIIENHEGRLWATANEGPGATFSFTIPVVRQDIDASAGELRA
jgi:PAS domain S-box-containing protein